MRRPPPGRWAVALAGAVSLAVAMGLGRFAFTPLLPMMLHDGVLDLHTASWLASANYLGYLAGALLCTFQPWIWARMPAWPPIHAPALVRGGLVATGLLTLGMALPWSAGWPVLRFAAGVASAVVFVYTSGWCLSQLSRMNAAAAGGAIYTGPGAGIVVSGVFASGMVQWGWPAQAGWLIFGVLAFVLSALVWRTFGEAESAAPAAVSATAGRGVGPPATAGAAAASATAAIAAAPEAASEAAREAGSEAARDAARGMATASATATTSATATASAATTGVSSATARATAAAARPRSGGLEIGCLALAYGLAGLGYIVTATFLPVIARAALPGSPWLDLFWPVFGAGVMIGALAATRVRPTRDMRLMLVGCYLLQSVGIAIGIWSPSLAGFAIGSLLLGLPFTAITFFGLQEVRRLRPLNAASFMGLMTALYGLGQIAGPPMVALLLRRSRSPGEGFTLALESAVGALLLGAVLYGAMWRRWPMRR